MVSPHERFEPLEPRPGRPPGGAESRVPWRLVVLWTTGPDTTLDGVFRVQAVRRSGVEGEGWERLDRWCRPFAGPQALAAEGERATARMAREYGVTGADLEGAATPEQAFDTLAAFLDGGPVLTVDQRGLEAWYGRFVGARPEEPVLGRAELEALLAPGRPPEPSKDRAWVHQPRTPEELRAALAELVGGFLALDGTTLRLAGAGFAAAFAGLVESDPDGARRLELALALVERPSDWAGDTGELFALHPALGDGRLPLSEGGHESLRGSARTARRCADLLRPRCAELATEWACHEALAIDLRRGEPTGERAGNGADEEPEVPLGEAALRLLDDTFQVHLARAFAEGSGDGPNAGSKGYRAGQHQVAREVAATLGARELLLVHAPTGTGKTLAYLVPALLWATANGVRVGVSTYTRALQEQAMDREVPRAIAALRAAGSTLEPRVTLLKGRHNYLCWRALCLHAPDADDEPAAWLAWTALVLFARRDPDGDLDRFPRRAPLFADPVRGVRRSPYRTELDSLVRAVRAEQGCCQASADRDTCGAETARFRAERSHLVITNHSFALARQTYFKRLIFDECEHLHDQAHAAFSHTVSISGVRELLERLRQPGRPTSRAPLDRLERVAPPDSAAEEALEACVAGWYATWAQVDALERAVGDFKRWRADAVRGRDRRDAHSLLREYVAGHAAPEGAERLLEARRDLHRAGTELETALAALAAELDGVPAEGMPRTRRALELLRSELIAVLEVLEAWIPLQAGEPRFRRETFHELEEDPRGRDVLAARVLLPNEFLGRFYYPQLSSAVLISATTWLRGGFDCAAGYLGLDRAAAPDEDEEREPCRVRTFRAPDPFDYGRVLVCVPDDAPEYRDKQAFDRYVRAFVSHLGERTRGRMLVLFTNAEDARRTGQELEGFFRARRVPFWFQNMPGHGKEELGLLFRERVDSILLGVDTFWYGADFPGETLEYLVIVKLPYGVPDAYHQAQCAVLGTAEQRRRIYMPRALAKLRQGFGRLMRRETDRGCVFVLDGRAVDPRHAEFLRQLPLASGSELAGEDPERDWTEGGARLLSADTDGCVHAALAHMSMLTDVRRRGLEEPFPGDPSPRDPARPREGRSPAARSGGEPTAPSPGRSPGGGHAAASRRRRRRDDAEGVSEAPRDGAGPPEILDIPVQDLPY